MWFFFHLFLLVGREYCVYRQLNRLLGIAGENKRNIIKPEQHGGCLLGSHTELPVGNTIGSISLSLRYMIEATVFCLNGVLTCHVCPHQQAHRLPTEL